MTCCEKYINFSSGFVIYKFCPECGKKLDRGKCDRCRFSKSGVCLHPDNISVMTLGAGKTLAAINKQTYINRHNSCAWCEPE